MFGRIHNRRVFQPLKHSLPGEYNGRRKRFKTPVFIHSLPKKAAVRNKLQTQDSEYIAASQNGGSNFHKLFYPGVPCYQRIMGLAVLMGCTSLCVYQLYERGSLYLSEPTTVDVIITRNDSITFPAFTLCSRTNDFLNAIRYDMNIYTDNEYNWTELWTIPFEENGLDLDELWAENAINASAVAITTTTRMTTSFYGKEEEFPGIMVTVDTAYCNCITFKPKNNLELKGRTYVNIVVDQLHILRRDEENYYKTDLYYNFHHADMSHKHEAMGFDDIMMNSEKTSLFLRIQKFSYKNKKRFDCQDEVQAHAEKTKCIDEAMRKANVQCRYPFINSRTDLRPCATLEEVHDAIHQVYAAYDEENVHNCHKKRQICRETVYSYPTPIIKNIGPSHSKLIVAIPDNTFQTVTESFTYSFAALLSDVGGSLGFFLGLSLLTLFDALQDLSSKFTKIFK